VFPHRLDLCKVGYEDYTLIICQRVPQAYSPNNRMKKIIEYHTAHSSSLQGLDDEVCLLIKKGYRPYGDQYYSAPVFVQPMVREASVDTRWLAQNPK